MPTTSQVQGAALDAFDAAGGFLGVPHDDILPTPGTVSAAGQKSSEKIIGPIFWAVEPWAN